MLFRSLYQPTHRHGPENQQDVIRFKNLLREIESSLKHKYPGEDIDLLMKPFNELSDDKLFWDNEEKLKTDEYYFLNLCEYSPKLHKPLKEYLDKKDAMEQEKNNIFIPEQSSIKNKTGDDWNWLNEL